MADAVIFDIDGTLIDTVDLHAQAWLEAFRAFGIEPEYHAVRHQIGKGGDQLMPVFVPPERLQEIGKPLEQFRGDIFRERYFPRARPFPQTRALFQRLRREGLVIAVGSSCKADELPLFTDLAEVSDLIDQRASSDDAERSKPSPDIFCAALEKLAPIPPEAVVVVGDAPYDPEAARRAGVRPIGVLCGGFREAELRAAGCVEVYRGAADLLARLDGSILAR